MVIPQPTKNWMCRSLFSHGLRTLIRPERALPTYNSSCR